jgi:RNA polymerase sigma-70 factor (family 1)
MNGWQDDKLLLEKFQKGDSEAFARLYELYAPFLVNFASSKIYSLELARDIIQDVFVSLWENRATLQITTNLKSFLFSAVRYKIIDHIRKNYTRSEYAEMMKRLTFDVHVNLQKQLEDKDLLDHINQSVEKMPERVKEIYKLSRNDNKSISEIASSLNLSEQTIKNQLTTALKFLRKEFPQLIISAFTLVLFK